MQRMVFYGVLDRGTREVVELFAVRADAERFIAECLADEPDWIDLLYVEPIEFSISLN